MQRLFTAGAVPGVYRCDGVPAVVQAPCSSGQGFGKVFHLHHRGSLHPSAVWGPLT